MGTQSDLEDDMYTQNDLKDDIETQNGLESKFMKTMIDSLPIQENYKDHHLRRHPPLPRKERRKEYIKQSYG